LRLQQKLKTHFKRIYRWLSKSSPHSLLTSILKKQQKLTKINENKQNQ